MLRIFLCNMDQEEQIEQYFHCVQCMRQIPEGESPRSWQRVQVGFTKKGIQIWCVRCDLNVAHFDFMGQKVQYAE